MFQQVRLELPPDAKNRGGQWDGANCEAQADQFARSLPVYGPPQAWTWNVRIQILLEDGTPVTAWHAVQADLGFPPIRRAAGEYQVRRAQDRSSFPPQRHEDQRIAELLLGEAVPLNAPYQWPRPADAVQGNRSHHPADSAGGYRLTNLHERTGRMRMTRTTPAPRGAL